MKVLRPLIAIKKYCLQCGDGTREGVKHCSIKDCPLRPYRFGMRPDTAQEKVGVNPID